MKCATLHLAILLVVTLSHASAVKLPDSPIQEHHLQALASFFGDELNTDESLTSSALHSESDSDRSWPKSAFKAGLYSALVPGMGEFYVGHKQKARFFFAAEALSWIGFASFRIYGHWKKDDLIRFAHERAGAKLEGKDNEFLDMVGFYDDIDEYNSFGRVFDPDRPYLEDNADNHWRWQSEGDQSAYRNLKNRSREAFRRSDFMIGLAVLNRVVSVIDAVRDARRSQRKLDTDEFGALNKIHYKIDIDPLSPRQQISLTLLTPF